MGENVPPSGGPGREGEVLEALREASHRNPRILEQSPEEVARRLVLEGSLRDGPPVELVAEMMLQLEAEEEAFDPDVRLGEV